MAQEYRGCRKLVYAEVLTDTEEGMTFGEVKAFAPVQTISKNVEYSTATSYYDNVGANTVKAEGADETEFTHAVPTDEVMSDIEGKFYDPEKKIYSDSPISNKFYAVGYIFDEEGDEAEENFCWKVKGTFKVGSVEHQTKNDGTDVTNVTTTFTAVYPKANFEHGGADGTGGKSKGVRIKKSSGIMTEEEFFTTPQTVDTVYTKADTMGG
jgi:hypothetical protein|nr:MAG TPA: tail tube protein [Caudoviricetes sp.]